MNKFIGIFYYLWQKKLVLIILFLFVLLILIFVFVLIVLVFLILVVIILSVLVVHKNHPAFVNSVYRKRGVILKVFPKINGKRFLLRF